MPVPWPTCPCCPSRTAALPSSKEKAALQRPWFREERSMKSCPALRPRPAPACELSRSSNRTTPSSKSTWKLGSSSLNMFREDTRPEGAEEGLGGARTPSQALFLFWPVFARARAPAWRPSGWSVRAGSRRAAMVGNHARQRAPLPDGEAARSGPHVGRRSASPAIWRRADCQEGVARPTGLEPVFLP